MSCGVVSYELKKKKEDVGIIRRSSSAQLVLRAKESGSHRSWKAATAALLTNGSSFFSGHMSAHKLRRSNPERLFFTRLLFLVQTTTTDAVLWRGHKEYSYVSSSECRLLRLFTGMQ